MGAGAGLPGAQAASGGKAGGAITISPASRAEADEAAAKFAAAAVETAEPAGELARAAGVMAARKAEAKAKAAALASLGVCEISDADVSAEGRPHAPSTENSAGREVAAPGAASPASAQGAHEQQSSELAAPDKVEGGDLLAQHAGVVQARAQVAGAAQGGHQNGQKEQVRSPDFFLCVQALKGGGRVCACGCAALRSVAVIGARRSSVACADTLLLFVPIATTQALANGGAVGADQQSAEDSEQQHSQQQQRPALDGKPLMVDTCTGEAFVSKCQAALEEVLGEMIKCDTTGTFQEPVDVNAAPGYLKVVGTPMAFATVRGKLGRREYTCFKDFASDVDLISKNAMKYNQKRSRIHRAATAMQRKTRKLAQQVQNRLFPPPPRHRAPVAPKPAAPPTHLTAAEAAAEAAARHAEAATKAAAAREAARMAQGKMIEAARKSAEAAAAIVRGSVRATPSARDGDESEASEAVSLAATAYSATDSEDETGARPGTRRAAPQQRTPRAASGGSSACAVAVTAEWRAYRSSIEWRCRWLELRMRELHAQRRHYERLELQLSDRGKEWQAASTGLEAEGRAAKCEEGAESKAEVVKAEPMELDEQQQPASPPMLQQPSSATPVAEGDTSSLATGAPAAAAAAQRVRQGTRVRKPRVHWTGVEASLAAAGAHPLTGQESRGALRQAVEAAPAADDNDASVAELHDTIARLQEKVDTLAHQLKVRRPGDAPPLIEAPPRRLPRVPLGPIAAVPASGARGARSARSAPSASAGTAATGGSDSMAVDAATPAGGARSDVEAGHASLKRSASKNGAESGGVDKKRPRKLTSNFDIGNVVMPTSSNSKMVVPQRHQDIQTPRVRLISELLAEDASLAKLRARPGWCDEPVGAAAPALASDAPEALDDASFLMRHVELELAEKKKYNVASEGPSSSRRERVDAAAAYTPTAAPTPTSQPLLRTPTASAGGPAAIGDGSADPAPKLKLVIRRQPSTATAGTAEGDP